MTRTRPVRDCTVCGRERPITGRGLCSMCFDRARRHGRLHEYEPGKVDRAAQVRPLFQQGLTVAEIADELGCSRDAVQAVVTRLRAAAVPTYYESLHVPAPPSRPVCVDAPEGLFDIPTEGGKASVVRDGRLLTSAASQVEAAFRYCAACPLATRGWCRDVAVRPKQSRANIITGGEVWVAGRRVWTLSDHNRREAVA